MDYDKQDLHQFIDALEASDDVEKQRTFIRMNPNARATYLHHLRTYAHSDAITLRKRATLLNVSRKLAVIDRECRDAGR
jgi:hypothetical protein